jgi:hypothetical protein
MSKVQKNMRREMDDLNQRNKHQTTNSQKKAKPLDGEYVDFEEID